MRRPSKHVRALALVLTGGCLCQVVGCASGVLPVLLSLGESTLLSLFTNLLFRP